MKRIVLTAAAAAAFVAVGVLYPVDVCKWFSQAFSGFADGYDFTGEDAVGGSWDAIPSGMATVTTVNGRKCLSVTPQVTQDRIRFVATNAQPDIVSVDFSVSTDAMPAPPVLKESERAGLCLLSVDSVSGERTFGGYTQSGWTNLLAHGFTQRTREWLDCRAEFDYTDPQQAYVTYYSDVGTGGYLPLTDAKGVSRFAISSTKRIRAVSFSGTGLVGAFSGFALTTNSNRIVAWNGGASGDWDTADNWKPARVPVSGDVVVINGKATVSKDSCTIYTANGKHELMPVGETGLRIGSGDLRIDRSAADAAWGTLVIDPGVKVCAVGTFDGIETGYGCTLELELDAGVLTVTKKPLYLDGVNLDIVGELPVTVEAVAVARAPYGSGGTPASLKLKGTSLEGWKTAWHGNPDGSSTLWLVNESFSADTAVWKGGADKSGNLATKANWVDEVMPSNTVAAWMGEGSAFNNDGNLQFARKFEIGAGTNETGKVSMSGGTVSGSGSGAIIVGANCGTGRLDVVGGKVRSQNYLWNSALTVGAGTNAVGAVRVDVESSAVSPLFAVDGDVSVGEGGSATLEVGRGMRAVGEVSATKSVAVGYDGKLVVSGGRLVGQGAFYIGRTTREEAYDVSMTVAGGVVSNVTAGAFWVGSYGGLGSKAAMTILGGEVYATNRFVCGGYRSATVSVEGGSLVSPEIRVGHDLIDENDCAAFALNAGCVTTGGFTSGSNGVRTVSLAGGQIVATTTNDDFFTGIESVRLDGETMLENASNVVIRSALTGAGGLYKTGSGRTTVTGYVAWAGPTIVSEGVLDMAGGMVMGDLSVADGASVVNAKYDDIDALELRRVADWDGATTTTSAYLLVQFGIDASAGNFASVSDGSDTNVMKGAISFVKTDDAGSLAFDGWTALGWTRLNFRDGSALTNDSYAVQMKFDFTAGKPYVIYYADGGSGYERLVSEDGLTVFPVAGGLSARIFRSVGIPEPGRPGAFLGWQMNVDASKTFYWTGAVDDAWTNAGNWRRIGVSDPAYPKDTTDTAYVENAASIRLSSGCAVGSLVANAPVTLSGQGLTLWKGVSGVGTLKLGGTTIAAAQGSPVTVKVALDILAGTTNVIAGDVSLYGSLRGAGSVSMSASIYGDTQEFAGKMSLVDGRICSVSATHNARSAWNVAGVPFALRGETYEFGSLDSSENAVFYDAEDVALVVGARESDCDINGVFVGQSGLEWIAKSATLTHSISNATYLKLSGGGKVAIGSADSVPKSISFVGAGGELSFKAGVNADVSPFLRDSTAPVVFNDGGVDRVWSAALSASNVGGFVKRGKGTLKWLKAPETTMDVTVEEGVLEIPYGTALGYVTILDGARIVVDVPATPSGIAFSAAGANRKLDESVLSFVPDHGLTRVYGENNSVIVTSGTVAEYVWSGAAGDGLWSTPGNWLVRDKVPKFAPGTNDMVKFIGVSCATVTLDKAVSVLKVSCESMVSAVNFVSNSIATRMSFVMPRCDIGLHGTDVRCGGDFNVRSMFGNGSVAVDSGTLVVSPQAGKTNVFSGTLSVTNLVKRGNGGFRYVTDKPFGGLRQLSVERGALLWDCSETNLPMVHVGMRAGKDPDTVLDLCGRSVKVGSFTGSGIVCNGVLVTADKKVTQSGGRLEIPIVADTTYYTSRADEKLELTSDGKVDVSVRIVILRSWFAAGASGRYAIKCNSTNIDWGTVKHVDEGGGWWSIPGGGFAVRLR